MVFENITDFVIIGIVVIIGLVFAKGFKTIRPTDVATIETLGKNTGFRRQGLTYVLPFVQKMYKINRTETLVDVSSQTVITKDNLNCMIDCQVYYKIKDDDASLKKVFYEVKDYRNQIVNLAQTTLRNVIGNQDFQEVNSQRGRLNEQVFGTIAREADSWGINIVRCEIKEISPPTHVQESMNTIIIASNTKVAARDTAEAVKIKAEGERNAAIEMAEGEKQTLIKKAEAEQQYQVKVAEGKATAIKMIAEAKAAAIKLESEAASSYFKDGAIKYKTLETNLDALKNNTKFVITDKDNPPTVIFGGENGTPIPIVKKEQ